MTPSSPAPPPVILDNLTSETGRFPQNWNTKFAYNQTAIDWVKYTNPVDYTMAKPRWFVIWDCNCETRNMSNRYEHDFPRKKSLRYFCRGCGKFARMDSQNVDVKTITQSLKRATAVMLDE